MELTQLLNNDMYFGRKLQFTLLTLKAALKHRYWSIGFSGGKDSSVVVDIAIRFLINKCNIRRNDRKRCPEKVVIVYSDTLLEPPPLNNYARNVVNAINKLAEQENLPIKAVIASPRLTDQDLVEMVIGRGYPAPSPRFRWCTDRWKIRPTKLILQKLFGSWSRNELAVITGIRGDEAAHRRNRAVFTCICPLKMTDSVGGIAYAPLINWSVNDVWRYIEQFEPVWGKPSWKYLRKLYGNNIDGLRMGCWVCTLIEDDQGWKELVKRGFLDKADYKFLMLWKTLWLHLSRGRPDLWREVKKRKITRSRRQWKYHYSKLRIEARLLLAICLEEIAIRSKNLAEILSPLKDKVSYYLEKLSPNITSLCRLLEHDNTAKKLLSNCFDINKICYNI